MSCTWHLVYADRSGCCVAIVTQQPHKMMHDAYNVKLTDSSLPFPFFFIVSLSVLQYLSKLVSCGSFL